MWWILWHRESKGWHFLAMSSPNHSQGEYLKIQIYKYNSNINIKLKCKFLWWKMSQYYHSSGCGSAGLCLPFLPLLISLQILLGFLFHDTMFHLKGLSNALICFCKSPLHHFLLRSQFRFYFPSKIFPHLQSTFGSSALCCHWRKVTWLKITSSQNSPPGSLHHSM